MIDNDNIFFMHYYRSGTAEIMVFDDWGDIVWWVSIEGLQNYKWN
jgi:hypothetical protein